MNSPLRYTDPSGNCVCAVYIFAYLVGTAMAHEGNKYWRVVGQVIQFWAAQGFFGEGYKIGGTLYAGYGLPAPLAAAAASGVTTATNGGSIDEIATSAIFAAAFAGAGEAFRLQPERLLGMHALLGCMQASAGGGECGPGAAAALASKAITMGGEKLIDNKLALGIVSALAGGTAAQIGGGKFANGALQGAFGYLFNRLATHRGDPGDAMSPESNPARGMSDTAGDGMGLKVLGYGLGGVSLVGAGAMAVSYSLAAPVGKAVFYTGFAKYGEGITLAAAAAGTPIFNTPLGRAMTSIQARWGSDRFWGRAWDAASAGYAHFAQGTVKVLEWVRNSASTFRRIELPILQRNGNQIVNVPPPGP
jgi:hypothetical protein